jgi:hypothetical protein
MKEIDGKKQGLGLCCLSHCNPSCGVFWIVACLWGVSSGRFGADFVVSKLLFLLIKNIWKALE